eukprot:scaffold15834_cov96-Isochrysis_galbana.AAC.4
MAAHVRNACKLKEEPSSSAALCQVRHDPGIGQGEEPTHLVGYGRLALSEPASAWRQSQRGSGNCAEPPHDASIFT